MDLPSTQQKILDSAKRWFLERGFKSAPLRAIVNDAGFTLGAFYGYYKNKEELFYALTDETAQGVAAIVGRGVTAIIGGGGKTTLMETLAGELSKKGKVIITTTTHICRPKQYETLLDADEAAVSAALERSGIVCVASRAESGKLCAPWLSMGTLAQLADFVLVEADGAKRLPLKAHASHEPVIPEEAQRVIMVIGIDGVGKTIRETCHRSALYAQLAGVDEETVVTPQLAARVVNAEGYGDRVYINKVESAADYEAAQAMANEFSCPVIAGSLHQGVYVCLH